ncbi:hypothetical protein J4222_00985 [Candidatus Woesearchaeota archaeon]|nr:hypothetical protein [Candidatus Woesearchaeota archaeon]
MRELKKLFFTKQFILLLLFAILLRSMWLITPMEIDEGVIVSFSEYMKDNLSSSPLTGLFDKSPIVYAVYMLPLFILNHSFLFYRLYGFLLYLLCFIFIVLISYQFSKNRKETYLAGGIFAVLMAIPFYHGFLNKVGLVYILFFTSSLYFLNKYLAGRKKVDLIIASIVYFLAIFSDPRVIYLSLFHIIYLFAIRRKDAYVPLITGIFALFAMSFASLLYIYNFNLIERAAGIFEATRIWYLNIPYQHNVQPSYIPLFLLQSSIFIFITLFSYLKRRELKAPYSLISLFCIMYLLFSLVLPTYGHYILNIVPLLALISANLARHFIKEKIFVAGLVFTLILTISSSVVLYPNLNVDSIELEFGPFSSLEEQNKITEFLSDNLEENQSFYYYGWNEGLYWLSGKKGRTLNFATFCNSSTLNYSKVLMRDDWKDYRYWEIEKHIKYVLTEKDFENEECFRLLFKDTRLMLAEEFGDIMVYEIIRQPVNYTPSKIIPYWFWNGNLAEGEITRQIELMQDIEISEVIIHARTGLEQEYLSEEWFYFVGYALKELEKRGMRAWIYDEFDWPSGRAGGKVLEGDYDLRAKNLNIEIVEGGSIYLKDINTDKSMIEVILDVTDITDIKVIGKDSCAEDYCNFEINSNAVIFYKDYANYRTETTGEEYVDLLDPETTELFIETTYEEYYKRFPEYFGTTIVGFFTDEPGLYGAVENYNAIAWTDDFDAVFYGMKGYNISENLYYIWHDSGELSEKTKADYFEVLTYAYSKNYFEKLHNWTSSHGVLLTGHLMGEENLWETVIYEGDFFTHQQYFDIYGTDDIFYFDEDKIHPVLLNSAKELYGSRPALTEAFAGYGEELTIAQAEKTRDWLLDNGVDIIVPHAFFYSLEGKEQKNDYQPSFFFNNGKLWPYMKGYVSGAESWVTPDAGEKIFIKYPIKEAWAAFSPDDNFSGINEVDAEMKKQIEDARKKGLNAILVPDYQK